MMPLPCFVVAIVLGTAVSMVLGIGDERGALAATTAAIILTGIGNMSGGK